jgi:peptide/nickel transport system substrate-binding protein
VGIGTKTESVTDNKLISLWLDNDFDLYIWGWAPDPDPDFILSTFTSAQCGYWSSACYFNPDYDKMYKEQQVAPTVEERQAIINQMQDIVYQNQPEIVLYYDKYLEAYRSDRWEGFFNSPAPDGILWAQYTPYSAFTVGPVTEEAGTTASSSGGGIPVGVWIGIGLVVAVIVVVALMRRGRDEEDEA